MSDSDEHDALADAASSTPFADDVKRLAVELERLLEGVQLRVVIGALALLVSSALEHAGELQELAPALDDFRQRAEALTAALLVAELVDPDQKPN